MTPLTRQQVRELIDANITALNARRAPNNQLRTYDQLHAGYSAEEKRDIAAVREEINRTGGAPRILLNAELSDAMAVTKKIPPSKACRRRTPRTTSSSSTNSPPPSNASRTKTPATTGYARTTPNTRRPSLAAPPAWPSPSKAATSSSRRSTTASARASTSASPPEQLQARLDHSQALLNNIAALEVKLVGGDDNSDDITLRSQPKTSNSSGNIINENNIEVRFEFDLSDENEAKLTSVHLGQTIQA